MPTQKNDKDINVPTILPELPEQQYDALLDWYRKQKCDPSFADIAFYLAKEIAAERDSWINQKANDHDERIRKAERERIFNYIENEKTGYQGEELLYGRWLEIKKELAPTTEKGKTT